MIQLPPLQLLEQNHCFPGPFMFKIIGKADGDFAARVVAVVREALGSDCDPEYRVRRAVGGRHLAITLEPLVQSADQVLEVYRRLSATEGVLMLF